MAPYWCHAHVAGSCATSTQKNELKPWRKEQWVIPPAQSAEFVYRMEDVLDVYHLPYDENYPVVCFDESSKQLVAEKRTSVPAKPLTV